MFIRNTNRCCRVERSLHCVDLESWSESILTRRPTYLIGILLSINTQLFAAQSFISGKQPVWIFACILHMIVQPSTHWPRCTYYASYWC